MRIVKVGLVKESIKRAAGSRQRAVADYMTVKVKMMGCWKYPPMASILWKCRKIKLMC